MNRKKYVIRTLTGTAAVFALFVGSINVSPALAANLEDVAVLGTLVRTFQWNAPKTEGGQSVAESKADIELKKNEAEEQLILSFDTKFAARYQARLAHFPETVTFTLPDTQSVAVLDAVTRAKDASSYIKSIYSFQNGDALMLQVEFEDTALVSMQEYENPGRIVVNLKPGEFEARDIYSVRTLSFADQAAYDSFSKSNDLSEMRVLRDDQEKLFVELAQFDDEKEANDFLNQHNQGGDLIVEKRWTNNVPVCYLTQKDFENAQLGNTYFELLNSTVEIDPILSFLDAHLAQADPEVQDTLLRGLTGWIREEPEKYDLDALNRYYKMAGQDIHDALSQ